MKIRRILRCSLITVFLLIAAMYLATLCQKWGVSEHIPTVFVFTVFLTSLLTGGYVYGVLASLAAALAVNYVFAFPFFAFNFKIPANLISAIIMTAIAILTGTLTTTAMRYENSKKESEMERMRANLLRAISHDLRTPLTTIYGASSTLLENGEHLGREQRELILRGIQEDSDWLVHMVENLLSITRIDSGRIKIRKTPTVLDELIDSVLMKFSKRYPNWEVTLDLPDEIIIIPMDALLIEQVLLNLLENAVIHAHGMTKLCLRVFPLGHLTIFEIIDDGCGIEPKRLKDIFSGYPDSLKQTSDGRKRNAGIGLSVCSTIISAHGGRIVAEQREGGGMIFRFTLDREVSGNDEQ